MAEFIINEKTIEIPDGWTHVTFDRFLGFAKICKTLEERDVVKDKESDIGLTNALKDLEDNTKILSYWCQLPEDEISMMDMEVANDIMKHLSYLNDEYMPINISSFSINDEKFILPEEFMQKSSFGRYIEAEQLELQTKLLKTGRLEIMPRQLAIICKKEGEDEKLNDALIDKRAELFRKLDMATIWDVAFFLIKLEQKLTMISLISQEETMKEVRKQELQLKEQ
tara:strand:+ start:606 stop:1280 length:675 start_codon:yes stop_codon:yes gene_type:complete